MALVGMANDAESEEMSLSITGDNSISTISPIGKLRGGYALAAVVDGHNYLDGRESVASCADSSSASKIAMLQLELEMEENNERLLETRMRKSKIKIELAKAESASGSQRSRTSRSLFDRNDLRAEDSPLNDRDPTAVRPGSEKMNFSLWSRGNPVLFAPQGQTMHSDSMQQENLERETLQISCLIMSLKIATERSNPQSK